MEYVGIFPRKNIGIDHGYGKIDTIFTNKKLIT